MREESKLDIEELLLSIGEGAKKASVSLAHTSSQTKNKVLALAADQISKTQDYILSENAKDLSRAKQRGLSEALLDRLILDRDRLGNITDALHDIAKLEDPIGSIIAEWTRPNGLAIQRVRAPIGVIGVIYESRPNVTADAAALCLKAGNAAILRCGSESTHSCRAILQSFTAALEGACLPKGCIQLVPTQNRLAVDAMLGLEKYIDVIVPRGGKSLIEKISKNCKIPVFKHLAGICHTYIHQDADPNIAKAVTLNAKLRRPGICGATETLLVDKVIASKMLPSILDGLTSGGCKIRGDIMTKEIDPSIELATQQDWDTEYLDNIISIRQVDNIDDAVTHIQKHGSNHTEAIITENGKIAELFLKRVESAIVMVNASTQFADGGEFGMGAEIGIATGKLHARGPVGIEQLTSMKYLVRGTGQIRP